MTANATPSPSSIDGSAWERAVLALRADPDQARLVRDAYYDDPLLGAATRYWQSEEWQSLRELLPARRGHALDVGAGRGIASYALAREGFDVTALEPDDSSIVGARAIRRLAEEAQLPIDVRQDFSERLPFPDSSFDLVFARAVLHHTSDLGAACREFLRVLRPGGQLIAIREHVISRPEDLPAFLDQHPLHRYYGGENAFLLGQYVTAIETAGFTLKQVLAPFDSAINYAPQTAASLKSEIAERIGRRVPGLASMVRAALAPAPVWALARRALRAVDHRPGRHYSFVAHRP